ncbi:hypothetical protein [Streptacidiphilus neutrinimicus]|uniref:hypothetical protein n=1 Tax=Streptacidiphilus neutrinimicus TaxID=105420 RepID=UPI0005AB7A6F|nr:hypothetical protein [Streptacidiphilus neutrinimicus]
MHTTLTTRSLAAAGAAALSAVLLLSGCSSAAKTSAVASGSATAAASSSAPATTSATPGGGASGTPGDVSATGTAVVVVHNADKGHTVTLHPGQTLEVVLTGGYWAAPASSAASVLKLSGGPSFASPSPGQTCRPGVDCRAQQTEFVAVSAGTATVSSSRSNCGEAMRCTDSNGKFGITVTVTAS